MDDITRALARSGSGRASSIYEWLVLQRSSEYVTIRRSGKRIWIATNDVERIERFQHKAVLAGRRHFDAETRTPEKWARTVLRNHPIGQT